MNFASQMTIFRWLPACLLRVSGADAATFLQGQFTQDIRSATETTAAYGLWLTLKGKVFADSFILRGKSGEFWICSYHCPAAALRERLESFVIADDVTIEDQTNDWTGITVLGPTPAEFAHGTVRPGLIFAGRRSATPHVEWLFPVTARAAVDTETTGLPEVSPSAMLAQRITAGIPAIPADIGPADLPNEGGLEADAISYTKGCYLGQEVMARLKSMGQVRRRLLHVRAARKTLPSLPCPLYASDKPVGELRSAVVSDQGMIGLALLTLMHLPPGGLLSFAPGAAGEVEATLPS